MHTMYDAYILNTFYYLRIWRITHSNCQFKRINILIQMTEVANISYTMPMLEYISHVPRESGKEKFPAEALESMAIIAQGILYNLIEEINKKELKRDDVDGIVKAMGKLKVGDAADTCVQSFAYPEKKKKSTKKKSKKRSKKN